MNNPKILYHFTNTINMYKILEEGKLRLTPSNIIKPTDTRIVEANRIIEGKVVKYKTAVSDMSDHYHPVVWLTTELRGDDVGNFKTSNKAGNKNHYRIGIKYCDDFVKWTRWEYFNELENNDPGWLAELKKGAKGWREFYICEREILTEEIVEIYDLYEHKYIDFKQGTSCIDISDIKFE